MPRKDVAVMDHDDDDDERPRKRHERAPQGDSLMDRVLRKKKELEDKKDLFFKPAQGINRGRIMPSWRGRDEDFYVEVPTHYGVGPDAKTFPCLQFWNETCPIDRKIEQLTSSHSARDQNAASRIMAKNRILVNWGYPNNEDGIVKVWSISESLFLELLGFCADPDYGNFTDAKIGYDVKFIRKGEKLQTRYTNIGLGKQPTRIKIPEWRSQLTNLDTFILKPTKREMRLAMTGEEE